VGATQLVEVPWREIYPEAQRGPWPAWNRQTGRLDLWRADAYFDSPALATLDVELAGGGSPTIRFRDVSTRSVVHEVPATLPDWTPEALLEAIQDWGLEDTTFIVGRGDEIELVPAPWPGGEEWTEEIVTHAGRYWTLTHVLDGFDAVGLHLWSSTDGMVWNRHDVTVSERFEYATLFGSPDRLLLAIDDDELWTPTSPEADSWSRVVMPPGGNGEILRTSFGWISQGSAGSGAISLDGVTWVAVDLPVMSEESLVAAAGGRLFIGPGTSWVDRYEPIPNTTWVGTFLPSR
jgi:hypothetical protein